MAKWSNVNPQTISEMTPREMRKTYSELRSIARKRADRLEAKGFETRRFDPIDKVPSGDLEESLAELAYYLQSPGSSVKTARKEKEQVSILARGYNIEDFDEFGDFMEQIRYRFKDRVLRDSDPYAVIYDEAEKRNMTVKTLQREFGKYLNYAETAEELKKALQEAPSHTGYHAYLTAGNLQKILEKRGIDAIYDRVSAAEGDIKPAKRRKAKR